MQSSTANAVVASADPSSVSLPLSIIVSDPKLAIDPRENLDYDADLPSFLDFSPKIRPQTRRSHRKFRATVPDASIMTRYNPRFPPRLFPQPPYHLGELIPVYGYPRGHRFIGLVCREGSEAWIQLRNESENPFHVYEYKMSYGAVVDPDPPGVIAQSVLWFWKVYRFWEDLSRRYCCR